MRAIMEAVMGGLGVQDGDGSRGRGGHAGGYGDAPDEVSNVKGTYDVADDVDHAGETVADEVTTAVAE